MRLITLIFILTLAAFPAVGYIEDQDNINSVPVPVVEERPKQSHYVVFLETCGVAEGVLLTTNPPIFVGLDHPADAYTLELIREALSAKRYMVVQHWRGYCPKPEKVEPGV